MIFFTFTAYLELFECVRYFFVVGYTLRCRVRVLEYDYVTATRYVSIDTQGAVRTDYEYYYYILRKHAGSVCRATGPSKFHCF